MRLHENRPIAFAVLAACVLASIFGFGGGALSREHGKAMKVFNEGTDTTASVRYSMDAYLDSAAERAQVMASEAELHLGATALVDSVYQAAEAIAKDETGVTARYDRYVALKTDVDKLYNAMKTGTTDADFRNFKLAYDDFWGQDDLMRHDDYPKYARAYNADADGFPAGIVAGLYGLDKLSTCGG